MRPMQLRRLRQWRADTQFIHMYRHPWTQACRMSAWLQDRLFVPIDYRDFSRYPPLPDPQIPWLRANENLDRFFAELPDTRVIRSEEHTSELQSLMRISYAVFCLKKKTKTQKVT